MSNGRAAARAVRGGWAAVCTSAPIPGAAGVGVGCRTSMDPPPALARRLTRLPRITVLGVDVPIASSRRARLLGLAFLERGGAGTGLWIPRCRSIHTFGMQFELEVLFIDDRGRVVRRLRRVPPARLVWCRAAYGVLERPAARCGAA